MNTSFNDFANAPVKHVTKSKSSFNIPDSPVINCEGKTITLSPEQAANNARITMILISKHWNDENDDAHQAERSSLLDPFTMLLSEPIPDSSASVEDAPADGDALYNLFSQANKDAYKLEMVFGPDDTEVRRNRVWHLPEFRHQYPADGSKGVRGLYENCGWRRHETSGEETRGNSSYHN
jgi:hypothetical protein